MKIAICGDIHSNFFALERVLKFLEDKIDALIITGDIVGYGPQPVECLNLLIDFPIKNRYYTVGNHDLGVRSEYCKLNVIDSCSEDEQMLELMGEIQPAAKAMFKQNAKELLKEHYNLLVKIPRKENFKLGDKSVYLTHGTPSKKKSENIGRYLFPPPIQQTRATIDGAKRFKDTRKSDIVIVGHTHQRFYINRNLLFGWSHLADRYSNITVNYPKKFSFNKDKLIFNPGSVGQPRDGNPDASFAIIDLESQDITFYSLKYPREELYKLIKEKCDPAIQDSKFWEIRF
ncbi:MAG: metallophosphoesterase family protein [Candidatus Hodarchaeales archaeon]